MSYYQPQYQIGYYNDPSSFQQPIPYTEKSQPTSLSSSSKSPSDDGKFAPNTYYRDPAFALLFLLQLGGIIAILVIGVIKYNNSTTQEIEDAASIFPSTEFRALIIVCVVCIVTSLFSSFIYLTIVKKFARQLIVGTLIASVIFWVFLALVVMFMSSLIFGLIFLIFGLFYAFLYFIWRSRIPFATVMLQTISTVIQDYPATIYTAYVSMLFQIVWLILWVAAVNYAQQLQSFNGLIVFFLLSLYWTVQVIKNVVHVTVSGTFASWYFLKGTIGVPHNPTIASLHRALTTSFGSICLGSLIVAALQTLRTIVQFFRRDNSIITCFVVCILDCLESLIAYFNLYAFTQVAIYGKSYCRAAKDTWTLIKSHGIQAIINDDIISGVLNLGCFLIGFICAAVGALVSLALVPSYWITFLILGFLLGFSMAMLTMEVVNSGVACIFVCFAMDPGALSQNDPFLFEKFRSTYSNNTTFV